MLMSTTLLLQVLRCLLTQRECGQEKSDIEIAAENIFATINLLKNECIRKIFSETHHAFIENAVFFLNGNELDALAMFPEFNKERAKTCLIHSAPLIIADIRFNSSCHYVLEEDVNEFLSSESRGGRFHIEYRSHVVRIGRSFLAFLSDTCKNEELDYGGVRWTLRNNVKDILQIFLTTKSISDLKFEEDPVDAENFGAFIEKLCAGDNYKKLQSPDPDGHMDIIQWLHRQLVCRSIHHLRNSY
ncbi:hypothetical protein GALMADRAFT_1360280 [Galerina marginata CBS 339.88]|uniref:Uncharacterized protein n=1 Tax=Galerina marginata (strain CBS 339.88) TaxID=685588 RepID=A0A067S6E0_GALM3|nr:hypothetical protein GALMADRAFT_1360280 [Galerina marginata CBS 339.88]